MNNLLKQAEHFLGLQPSQSSLVGAMNELTGEEVANNTTRKAGGIPIKEWAPYVPFPNVTRFEIVVSKLDELFLKLGIKKRLERAGFKYTVYKNKDMNRYIAHQLKRLDKLNNKQYGYVSELVLRRSRTFYMMAVRHVFPKGHREMPGGKFLKMRREVKQIMAIKYPTIEFARLYISKPKGGGRPLGVPTASGRVYLHIRNQLLVRRIDPYLNDNQHGFRPGRGTLTAGKKILSEVINQDYIYEYDFKGYFDNLKQDYLFKTLKERFDMEGEPLERLEILTKSLPKLAKKDVIPERDRTTLFSGDLRPNINKPQDRSDHPFDGDTGPIKAVGSSGPEGPIRRIKGLEFVIQDKHTRSNMFGLSMEAALASRKTEGVPQGSPMSPFLSNISLDQSLLRVGKKIVQYADDGILYGNKQDFNQQEEPYEPLPKPIVGLLILGFIVIGLIYPWLFILLIMYKPPKQPKKPGPEVKIGQIFNHPDLKSAGVQRELSKCKGVKIHGVGQRPLKFLGLEYDGITNTLKANTRKGSQLIYDKASLIEAKEAGIVGTNANSVPIEGKASGERFTLSKYAGGVMSRLYNGSGNQDEYFQNFNLNFARGTWVHSYVKGAKGANRQQDELIKESIELNTIQNKYTEEVIPFDYDNFKREIMKLTVFNSTTIATRSALEAIRLAEGMPVVQPTPSEVVESEKVTHHKDSTMEAAKGGGGMNYNKYQKMNIKRGQKAYAGSLSEFRLFLLSEIGRMTKYSKYTPEEMGRHYHNKYILEQIRLMELHIAKTGLLIAEVRRELSLSI